ncbi:MAG TPA: DNA-binding domain-containing protein [Terracidiphilus sp.]|nr:DNA-binding domain-containing protein [Terracidiphilus sp.]
MQREMAAAVMMPLTGEDGMQKLARDGRQMIEVAGSFVNGNSALTPFERLEIYNRQYWFRVLDALAEDFTALAAVIGPRRFGAMSVAYLDAHPSKSYTLRNIGLKLAEYLVDHPEFTGRRGALAVDVARLEWLHVEAFDGEEWTALAVADIAQLSGDSRLSLQPHLRLLEINYAVDELVIGLHREAHNTEGEDRALTSKLPRAHKRRLFMAVHRADHTVYYRRLEREEFMILQELRRGEPLAKALDRGFIFSRHSARWQAGKVSEWFRHWAEMGWLCAPAVEGSGEERI